LDEYNAPERNSDADPPRHPRARRHGRVLRGAAARAQHVTVYAAASLTDALNEIGGLWVTRGNPAPKFSFAASSTLARQIENGAPAEIFVSADEDWMDYLATRRLIVKETRTSRLSNRLVLVAPADRAQRIDVKPGFDLAGLLGKGRLATGDPASVPVGRYAQAALISLGVWAIAEPRLARAENVRAALALVERGEAPLGIVYATDAAMARGVRVVAAFPPGSHPPVSYPFALVAGRDTPPARALLAFVVGGEARAVYEKFGFVVE
jgi:molybdate transport system substrate-binding protein